MTTPIEEAPVADEEIELLTSPIERRSVSRLFVIGGPLGLAIAIMVSLWVASLGVSHSVIVQTEPTWVPGERLALRVQVTPEGPQPPESVSAEVVVEQLGQRYPLPAPTDAGTGLLQGGFEVPSLTSGPAVLHVHVDAPPWEPRDEQIEIEVVERREANAAEHVVSSSMSQYADDSDPQPESLKIDVRPRGRVLAGFDNELWLRITDAAGKPWSGRAAIRLVDGELADARGDPEQPPLLWEGRTDAAGLASIHGVLSSEVLRLRVEVLGEEGASATEADAKPGADAKPDADAKPEADAKAEADAKPDVAVKPDDSEAAADDARPDDSEAAIDDAKPGDSEAEVDDAKPDTAKKPEVLAQRMIRLVSFAGAVHLRVDPATATPGEAVEVLAAGLSGRRPVFVDVYGADGAWTETFAPPVQGREPPRSWTPPPGREGLLQLEAYHFTNEPGESTAVARLLVDERPPIDLTLLQPLIARQRATLGLPRLDRTWDEARERAYLDALAERSLPPEAMSSARAWLAGTLPIEVHGPPTVLRSRERDLQAMLDTKKAWAMGMRIFLLAGGGLFLLAMTILMVRSHARDAEATLRELRTLSDGAERELLEAHVLQARRAALLRGLLMIVMMAGGVACAVLLLEAFVWDF